MAHCETVAWGKCNCCDGNVAVKKNRSQLAYYRCDHCGAQVQHHWQKSSAKFLESLGVSQGQDADEKPAAKPVAAPKKAGNSLDSFFR